MLKDKMLDEMKVLRDFYRESKQQNSHGRPSYRKFRECSDDAVKQDYYQEITNMGTHKPIMHKQRYQNLDDEECYGGKTVSPIK